MKKIIVMIVSAVIMIMMCACGGQQTTSKVNDQLIKQSKESIRSQYAMATVVVGVNEKEDEVTCIDFNGNEWVFCGNSDSWFIGDVAAMVMDDCGTEIIYDDEIISVKYDGWIDGNWGWDGAIIAEFH